MTSDEQSADRPDPGPPPFDCPRCGRPATERFWGPCTDCRAQLIAAHRGESGTGEVEASRFEPVMHVVANHVATKD
jgi:hypothetical protein